MWFLSQDLRCSFVVLDYVDIEQTFLLLELGPARAYLYYTSSATKYLPLLLRARCLRHVTTALHRLALSAARLTPYFTHAMSIYRTICALLHAFHPCAPPAHLPRTTPSLYCTAACLLPAHLLPAHRLLPAATTRYCAARLHTRLPAACLPVYV